MPCGTGAQRNPIVSGAPLLATAVDWSLVKTGFESSISKVQGMAPASKELTIQSEKGY